MKTPYEKLSGKISIDFNRKCTHLWTGAVGSKGYGMFKMPTKLTTAHRALWTVTYGEPGPEFQVCHKCDNRLCVTLEHLFLGTNQENVDDRESKGRGAKGELSGMAKYDKSTVMLVRFLYSIGTRPKDLSDWFEMPRATVRNIVKRVSWASV